MQLLRTPDERVAIVTVARNAIWNVGGQIVSACVGLTALPLLLHALGAAGLGVFTLALGLIGFSGLFDLGLSRALTQTVSEAIGQGCHRDQVAALVWRVITLLAASGLVWALVLWVGAPLITHKLFHLTGDMASETIFGVRALAFSMPLVLAATGEVGALEGLQQFRLLSLWRAPMSVLQFGLPVTAAFATHEVGWTIAALAATRVAWLALWTAHLTRLLPRTHRARIRDGDLRHAARFGGWLSVSNVIGPLMTYTDRFYLATVFPPASVAYYAVPFDAAYRASSLPQTAVNAVFPAFAGAQSNPTATAQMLRPALHAMFDLALPATLLLAVLAKPILSVWLGTEFATAATDVLKLLALGLFFNSVAHLPYALLQAHGRSDLTAKVHLAEVPIFALALVWCVHLFGITGAALAWTIRTGLDAWLLYACAWVVNSQQRRMLANAMKWLCTATCVFLLVTYAVHGTHQWILTFLVVVACTVRFSQGVYFQWGKAPTEQKQ